MTLWTRGPLWFGPRIVTDDQRAAVPGWYEAIETALSVRLVPMVGETNRRLLIQDSNGDEQEFWIEDD